MDKEKLTAQAMEETPTLPPPFDADDQSPYIFVSYAHADSGRVYPIITRLYEKGWHIWYDAGIPVGSRSDYVDTLSEHIEKCERMLVFVTATALKSEFVVDKELLFGILSNRKKAVFCLLEDDLTLPKKIEFAAADKQNYPQTDEAGLEAVLESIESLARTAPRKAKGISFRAVGAAEFFAAQKGAYDYKICDDGVSLTRYFGKDKDVTIPKIYMGLPVVELSGTFHNKMIDIRTVHIPATVKRIKKDTFYSSLTYWEYSDEYSVTSKHVYIPASVTDIEHGAFGLYVDINDHLLGRMDGTFNTVVCTIHCAERTAAYNYVKNTFPRSDTRHYSYSESGDFEDYGWDASDVWFDYEGTTEVTIGIPVEIDPSLDVVEDLSELLSAKNTAFISYADDKKKQAQKVINMLTEMGCKLVDSGSVEKEHEKLRKRREADCFVALVSKGYNDGEIERLLDAIDSGQDYILYELEQYKLPARLGLTMTAEQRIGFDKGEETQFTMLINWLSEKGCMPALTGINESVSKAEKSKVTSVPVKTETPAKAEESKTTPEPAAPSKETPAPKKQTPTASSPQPKKKSRPGLVLLLILLALVAAAAGVQFSGLFDILGWLSGLIR